MDLANEEALREASSIGDVEEIARLIKLGVDINSTNKMNGWSPLHWAAKRGHSKAVGILLQAGADKDIINNKRETPADLSRMPGIRKLLGVEAPPVEDSENQPEDLKFTPNYLSNPSFIYSKASHHDNSKIALNHSLRSFHYRPQTVACTTPSQWAPSGLVIHPEFLVLCVRLGNVSRISTDFIEVEISRLEAPTLLQLIEVLCENLDMGIHPKHVQRIRKLPHSTLRSDRDVLRLTDYQALEIILQPDALHPFDGHVLPSDLKASPDSLYLKEHVSKLVY